MPRDTSDALPPQPYQEDGEPRWEILEERTDWLTVTAKPGEGAEALYDAGSKLLDEREREGNKRRIWRFQGSTGHSCGGVQRGFAPWGSIVRLSGERSSIDGVRLYGLPHRCRRIDFEVTARSTPDLGGIAQRAYSDLGGTTGRRDTSPKRTLYVNDDGGETLYLGQRKNDVFCRLYNKTAESEGEYPPGCWRWEVELKGDTADGVWHHEEGYPQGEGAAIGLVAGYFARYGLHPPWHGADTNKAWQAPRPKAQAERSFEWLGGPPARAIAFLQSYYSDEEIALRLGLNLAHERLAPAWSRRSTRGEPGSLRLQHGTS